MVVYLYPSTLQKCRQLQHDAIMIHHHPSHNPWWPNLIVYQAYCFASTFWELLGNVKKAVED